MLERIVMIKPTPMLVRFASAVLMAFFGLFLVTSASTATAQTTYYWDGNNDTSGFATASGTWAGPTAGTPTSGWSTSAAGTAVVNGNSVATGTADSINFGNGATGLAAGTINVSGTVSSGNMTFASGSGAITLSGGTITLATAQTTTVNNASNTISSVLAGAATSVTKAGAGTLILGGANTYSGNTVITAGTVNISNAASFGTGNVSITGTSRINATGGNGVGLTYVNPINVGAALTLQNPQGATGATATFSGQLTGSSNISIVNGGGNAVLAGLAFTNTGNSYTGSVLMPSGIAPGDDRFSFNSIGDGGTFTFQKRGHQNAIIYTGSTDVTFNTRSISLGAGFGGVFDGGGVTPVNRFMNNGSSTVTFNANLTSAAITTNGTFFFDGTNTGNNTYAGVIFNPTSGGDLGIGKNGSGKWILTGANQFDGEVVVANGTLSVNSVAASSATNQPLGNNAVIQLGHSTTSGTLEFTGSSDSTTDKQIRIGNTIAGNSGAGTILNNGTGSLAFSNAAFNPSIAGITASRTLTLGGSYSGGANGIQGVIQNNAAGGLVALSVSGSHWTLSGNNTYTGGTTISGGTLQIGNGGTSGQLSTTSAISNDGTLAFNRSDAMTQGTHFSADMTGTGAVTKSGAGTLTFNSLNTYTGGTTVNQGTLALAGGVGSFAGVIRGTLNIGADGTVDVQRSGTGWGLGFFGGISVNTINLDGGALRFVDGLAGQGGTAASNINMTAGTISGTGTNTFDWYFGNTTTPALNTFASANTATVSANINLRLDNNTNSLTFNVAEGAAATDLLVSGNIIASGSDQGFGQIIKTGSGRAVFSGTNTYTGDTTVSGGTLAVNGSLANTTVTVGTGATLQGSGSIAGSVTINDGGTLATGNSIESMATGALSLTANSTFAYEMDNDAAPSVAGDLTAVTGNLTLDLGNTAILTLVELGSGSWAPDDKLTLISYSGAWNGGLFDYLGNPLADDSTFTFSGIDWTFNYDDDTPGTNFVGDLTGPSYVTMVAVPEPSAIMILGAGVTVAGMGLARRRFA
jgi:autotransporter-associated beta strand protein